jgi:hypothetical protein
VNDDTAAAILDELRVVRRLLEALHRERSRLTPAQRDVFAAVVRLYRPGEVFGTANFADASRFDCEALAALQRACNGDTQRLGIALRQLADSGVTHDGLRLIALPAEAGSRRWALEVVESL